MNILDKIRGVVGEDNNQGDEYSSHVVLMDVEIYEEVGKVATYLLEEKSIIINVKTLTDEEVEKVVSFLEGSLFIIGGEMKQLDDRTFLCVPNSVAIIGKEAEALTEKLAMEEDPITEESTELLGEEQGYQQRAVENV